ncbi:MAG: hypothetical protein AAF570_18475, partial [Bacteroidota bacterium]
RKTRSTPDGGLTKYWKDALGRDRFSQDARQTGFSPQRYSYLKYDALGRLVESGESDLDPSLLSDRVDDPNFPSTAIEWSRTHYSAPHPDLKYGGTEAQRYLRNRVSFVERINPLSPTDTFVTVFSYDPHGQLEWLVQELPGLGVSWMRYEYDLVSGKVLESIYNEGKIDEFHHRYTYDRDNRITLVETSRDGWIWDRDLSQSYYAHGPTDRLELGEDRLQGLDMVYNLHGQLKALNHATLQTSLDPGQDNLTGVHEKFAPDAFGFQLGYFNGDFVHTGSAFDPAHNSHLAGPQLYDGNITSWTWNTQDHSGLHTSDMLGQTFRYDALYQLKRGDFQEHDGSHWVGTPEWASTYTYDPNGNLSSLTRLDQHGNPLDALTYHYNPLTNRLDHLTDAISTPSNERDLESQLSGNYSYDGAGNLIADVADSLDQIDWNVSGKISRIQKRDGSEVHYSYDAKGDRSRKRVIAGGMTTTTWYGRDASGVVRAIYVQEGASAPIEVDELTVGAGNRIGTLNPAVAVGDVDADPKYCERKIGEKTYELHDHLGNARVRISDVKISQLNAVTGA